VIIRAGGNTLDCDVEATIAAYSAYTPGLWKCDCCGCRNFRLAHDRVFTGPVLAFFKQFGINTAKPHECYDLGISTDMICDYGGWFHFIGKPISDDDIVDVSESLRIYFLKGGTRPPAPFFGQPWVQMEFELKIPWLVAEPWGSDRRPACL
jgi:hypothetical protein